MRLSTPRVPYTSYRRGAPAPASRSSAFGGVSARRAVASRRLT